MPLCFRNQLKSLEVKKLYNVTDSDNSQSLGDVLERQWETELNQAKLNKRRPSLLRAFCKVFGVSCVANGILMALPQLIR